MSHRWARTSARARNARRPAGFLALLVAIVLLFPVDPSLAQSRDDGYRVGVNYSATSDSFAASGFIRTYHLADVRAGVRGQLQRIADDGASLINTTLWLVGPAETDGAQPWQVGFPPSAQERANVRQYAADVAGTRSSDGRYLSLSFTLRYLWCADYTLGSPEETVGRCALSWPDFLGRVWRTVSGLLADAASVRRPDGQRVVEVVYLDGEISTSEKANQERFLADLYPWFLQETRSAGVLGSLYFLAGGSEEAVLQGEALDPLDRSLSFLAESQMPLPARVDLSFFPRPEEETYGVLVRRLLDSFQSRFPGRDLGVLETYYPESLAARRALGQAFVAEYQRRGMPRRVLFWPTSDSGPSTGAVPPLDFASYLPATISASPTVLAGGPDLASTTVSWDIAGGGAGEVHVSVDNGNEVLFAASPAGSAVAPWIASGHTYAFRLYSGTGPRSLLGSTVVTRDAVGSPIATPTVSPIRRGDVAAVPNPVPAGAGPGRTTITWGASGWADAEVYVSVNGETEAPFATGAIGSQSAGFIASGQTYVFRLYAGTTHQDLLGSVAVTRDAAASPGATPTPTSRGAIVVVPNPVPAGASTTTVTWSNSTFSQVWVALDGGAEVLFTQGASGSASAPWIQSGHTYVFSLYDGTSHAALLSQVAVVRSASNASLTADPNPVPAGSGPGTTTVSWSTGGESGGEVWVGVDGGAEVLFASGADGTAQAPWIQAGHAYRFTLYEGTGRVAFLASTTVVR